MMGFLRGGQQAQPDEDEPKMVFKSIDSGGGSPIARGPPAAAIQSGGGRPPTAAGQGGPAPVTQREVQTLLSRVQTSTVAQDRREALEDLTSMRGKDIGHHFDTNNIAMLLNKMRVHLDDHAISGTILELLSTVLEALRANRQEDLRGDLLNELMDITIFLEILKSGSFWPKYHSVQMLIHLQEYDGLKMQRLLLEAHGVDALVDVLNDSSNDGVLRNEGLTLLNAISMADQDVQFLLAFNDCYDSLFRIIEEEGGIFGGTIVCDCLMLMTNLLRANKAAELFYQGEGFRPVHLNKLLNCPFIDQNVTIESFDKNAGNILSMALRVFSGVVDGADKNGKSAEVRKALVTDSFPKTLVALALTKRLDAMVTIEALRGLNLLLKGQSKPVADALLNVSVRSEEGKGSKPTVSCIYGMLKLSLTEKDTSKQSAAISCVVSLIAAGGMNTALLLVRGFTVSSAVSSSNAAAAHANTSSQDCGKLLAALLFWLPLGGNLTPTALGQYHAAMILNQCIAIPQVGEQLQSMQVSGVDGVATSFLQYYTHHVRSALSESRADLATLSALMRPLFTWLRWSTKALINFLENESHFEFFAQWSTMTRKPLHMQLLCGSICVLAAAMCPQELPASVKQNRNQIFEKLYTIVRPRAYADVYYNVGTTTEWQHTLEGYTGEAAGGAGGGAAIYDGVLKQQLEDLSNYIQNIIKSMANQPAVASVEQEGAAGSPQREASPTPSSPTGKDATSPQGDSSSEKVAETVAASSASLAVVAVSDSSQQSLEELKKEMEEQMAIALEQQRKDHEAELAKVKADALSDFDKLITENRNDNDTLNAKIEECERLKREQSEAVDTSTNLAEELKGKDTMNQSLQEEVSKLAAQLLDVSSNSNNSAAALEEERERIRKEEEEKAAVAVEEKVAASLQAIKDELAATREEFQRAEGERDELLILVAELDEEREGMKVQFHDLSTIQKPYHPTNGGTEGCVDSTDTSLQFDPEEDVR